MLKWAMGRVREPSTYAAVGVAVMGVGILIDQPYLIMAGIAVGVLAFVLKERAYTNPTVYCRHPQDLYPGGVKLGVQE